MLRTRRVVPCLLFAAALCPGITPAGDDVLLPDAPGKFAPRATDLFVDDGTDFGQAEATTVDPAVLLALAGYDMDLDPLFDGAQKLTRPGTTNTLTVFDPSRQGAVGPSGSIEVSNAEGDRVLYIDLTSFYDDVAGDMAGFWANWTLFVMPIDLEDGFTDDDFLEFAEFETPLRGPFWNGDRLEVGDTAVFRPQVMHYTNLGIWNWEWSDHDTVRVLIQEGDGEEANIVASLVARRDETASEAITLSSDGDVVSISLTEDDRMQRTVIDDSGMDADGLARSLIELEGLTVDLTLETQALEAPTGDETFAERHVIGPNRVVGAAASETFPWTTADFAQGSQLFRYVDNISYIPGWDCDEPVDGEFQFFIEPGAGGVMAVTELGGCEDRTSLFFRGTEVTLPDLVEIKELPTMSVASGETDTFSIERDMARDGLLISELLGYETDGGIDFGFSMTKSMTDTSYDLEVDAFGGAETSAVEVRATVLEWPKCLPAQLSGATLSTADAGTGQAHRVLDLDTPIPDEESFVVHEVLTYEPDADPDMAWTLYFEPIESGIDFQLASSDSDAPGSFVESEATIVQFPVDLGLPVADALSVAGTPIECTSPDGAAVALSGAGSLANVVEDVSEDSIAAFLWSAGGNPVAEGEEVSVQLALGDHTFELLVEDQCGFTDMSDVSVTVEDTTAPEITGLIDATVTCTSPAGIPADDPAVAPFLDAVMSEDVCDEDSSLSNDAPDIFPIGSTAVTWEAEDATGNMNAAIQNLTVTDPLRFFSGSWQAPFDRGTFSVPTCNRSILRLIRNFPPDTVGIEALDVLTDETLLLSPAANITFYSDGEWVNLERGGLYAMDRNTGDFTPNETWEEAAILVESLQAVDLLDGDAIAFSPGETGHVFFGSNSVFLRDIDVYRYTPGTNEIDVLLDGDAIGLRNLDGVDVFPDGKVAFSTRQDRTIFVGEESLRLRHQNAYVYDPNDGSVTLALDGLARGLATLDAFSLEIGDDLPGPIIVGVGQIKPRPTRRTRGGRHLISGR